jgi:hypothetical protein
MGSIKRKVPVRITSIKLLIKNYAGLSLLKGDIPASKIFI